MCYSITLNNDKQIYYSNKEKVQISCVISQIMCVFADK